MSLNKRKLSYSLAINQALTQLMEKHSSVFLMGQGIISPWYVGNTCQKLLEKFGKERVIDTPISENAMTGAVMGASLIGMRPIIVHPRMDFMLYAMDPIINEAANWHYMLGGKAGVPLVIWAIINRGNEQAAQHSQAFQSLFAHIPGLKIVAPSNPYDAKGLLISALYDDNPVLFVDDRWLYNSEAEVPEEMYQISIGKGSIKKEGTDVTILASSFITTQALKAAQELEKENISAEVIDLRTIKPLDKDLIFQSVKKTGRLVIVDSAWKFCGISAEISALVSENISAYLKSPIKRVCLPDVPAPASSDLEDQYYINKNDIIAGVKEVLANI